MNANNKVDVQTNNSKHIVIRTLTNDLEVVNIKFLHQVKYIPSIDTFIKSGLPLIKDFDINPIKTVIQAADLSRSSMTLVDFQFEPVVLLSPLFVTLKIKPVKKYVVGVEK